MKSLRIVNVLDRNELRNFLSDNVKASNPEEILDQISDYEYERFQVIGLLESTCRGVGETVDVYRQAQVDYHESYDEECDESGDSMALDEVGAIAGFIAAEVFEKNVRNMRSINGDDLDVHSYELSHSFSNGDKTTYIFDFKVKL